MPSYIVTYDLRAPGRDYQPLYAYLNSLPYAVRPLESVWLVETTLSPFELRDALAKVADANDGILVVHACTPAAWTHLNVKHEAMQGHFD
ncbi:hypothetical protein CSIV_04280 [Microbacterium sp. CSI-V]|uniref:hypothetical protein n=1 Tax=unclassified Microbacterium TaxID=2609290 RepID=UPI00097BFC5D|nr:MULTISPECIES: hypothetical protein [unclassified Microbacterium]MXS74720.1 hypothetical protein [Microbacterium sp. TL13]ONI65510.1 hypothetical protein CSIV_04280 [Microbacterium sp. CSI-V]